MYQSQVRAKKIYAKITSPIVIIWYIQFRYLFRQISEFLEDSVDVFYGTWEPKIN